MTTYTITADVGSYLQTGVNANLLSQRKVKALVGAYLLTGVHAASGISPVQRMELKQATRYGAPASKTFKITWWRR